jgi:sulfur-oxidizing protein SoxZ
MCLMSDDIRLRARQRDGLTEILVLLPHPMETGLRRDGTGALVPAHFIMELNVTIEGRPVAQARLTQAVSQDPLLTLRVRGARVGERVAVSYVDSRGQRRSAQKPIS